MNLAQELQHARLSQTTRRLFLQQGAAGLGRGVAVGYCGPLHGRRIEACQHAATRPALLAPLMPPLPAKAKRVIYLHMAGSPSQLDLFDYKPELHKLDGQDCPQEFIAGKRFAFIRGVPKLLGPQFPVQAAWRVERVAQRSPAPPGGRRRQALLRAHGGDRSVQPRPRAAAGPHRQPEPRATPSMGSWATYGLGSENQNLPGFVVLLSGGKFPDAGKSVWGSGFLPSVYQGVQCRSSGDPVLFLSEPGGNRPQPARPDGRGNRRRQPPDLQRVGRSRDAHPHLAVRACLPHADVGNRRDGPQPGAGTHPQALYGTQPGQESLANNCLLAAAARRARRALRAALRLGLGLARRGDERRRSTTASKTSAGNSTNR